MGWLWNGRGARRQSGRGKPRSRPRVTQAIIEAAGAYGAPNLGGATALLERASWAHPGPARAEFPTARVSADLWLGSAAPARRQDFGDVGWLLERAEDTARKLGRTRAEMWEEALRAWLDAQSSPALALTPTGAPVSARVSDVATDAVGDVASDAERTPRPWLFEARRQRVWGEIDETLGALRTA